MRKTALTLSAASAAVLSALALTACGGSSSSAAVDPATAPTATTATATTPSGVQQEASTAAGRVGVSLGGSSEFSIAATPATAAAGKVTFAVRNDGSVTHELVVVKTDKAPGALAPGGASRADETGSAGESGDLKAGASTSFALTLPAGHYVLLCNLPGHYAGGMYTAFTVK